MRKRKPCVCEVYCFFFFFFEFIAFNNSSDLTHQSLHKRTGIWSVLDLSGFNRETDATLYIPGMNALCVCVGGGGGGGLVVGFFLPCRVACGILVP